jgi:hypothetical protein
MTEKQIPKLAGMLVEHQSNFQALSSKDGQWVIQNTQKAIALFVSAVANRTKEVVQNLLQFITTIRCSAVKKFVASEHFVEGQTTDGVKIAHLADNFKKLFLSKTEENVPAVDVRIHKLLRQSKDLGIRAEIGEANEEIHLASFWQVMKSHDKISTWLVAYITDNDGNLWAVRAGLRSDGWHVTAFSVAYPSPWLPGSLFCSR